MTEAPWWWVRNRKAINGPRTRNATPSEKRALMELMDQTRHSPGDRYDDDREKPSRNRGDTGNGCATDVYRCGPPGRRR